jgi:hypothetical protein
MIHDFLIRRTQLMRLAALFLVPLAGISPSLQAQQAGAAELKRENTLGMSFLAVPGTSVLFSQYETTVEQWQAFIKAENYKWDYVPHFEQGPTHPVVGITLQDARRFCSWLTNQERNAGKLSANESYRLPTQVEWDAAIGLKRTRKPDLTVDDKMNDDRAFPWGMDWPPPPKVANFSETSIPDPQVSSARPRKASTISAAMSGNGAGTPMSAQIPTASCAAAPGPTSAQSA